MIIVGGAPAAHATQEASGPGLLAPPPALQQRRMREIRWIFAQRRMRCPDDSPFRAHTFDPDVNYTRVNWGEPCRKKSGNVGATFSWTWPWISGQVHGAMDRSHAASATGLEVAHSPWGVVWLAPTGHVRRTWLRHLAWMVSIPCAGTSRSWKPFLERTSLDSGDSGIRGHEYRLKTG
eukprot:4194205-Amphidinium_carterae.1